MSNSKVVPINNPSVNKPSDAIIGLEDHEIEYLVRLHYKSGSVVECWFTEFEYKQIGNQPATLTWKITNKMMRRPLMMGIDDIESAWIIDMRPLQK